MTGRVCEKHEVWCASGECPDCEGMKKQEEAKHPMQVLADYEKTIEVNLLAWPPPLVPGAFPIPALANGRGLRLCVCGQFQCVDTQAGWIDYATGTVHTPVECAIP